MATDTAVAAPLLPPVTPTAARRAAGGGASGPVDPMRHLWQLPVLLLGIGVFVSAWQGWLPVSGSDPPALFARDVAELKAAYEKVSPDPVTLKTQLKKVAEGVESYPDQAPRARFHLGSGYVRLAELTPVPDEARGYWTLAYQHLGLVTEKQLRDPVEASKYGFRFNKARVAVGLAPDTPATELNVLMTILSNPPSSEEAGEAQRLVAELALRLNPPDTNKAKLALSLYLQSGIATPSASLARGRLRLGQLYLQTQEYDLARKVLIDIGDDAPPDVRGPAKAELAKVLLAEGNWTEAAKELETLRGAPGVSPALRLGAAYQLGVCKLRDRKLEEAVRMFEEAAKGDGPEARAAAYQLADLHIHSPDPARHKAAVERLADALKGVRTPAEYDPALVPLTELQATFELVVTTLLNDGAHESALVAAETYSRVSAPGRDREKRAEVLGAWGDALKKTLGDPKPKYRDAATEFAALVDYQPKNDGKLDMLRSSAKFFRLADDPNTAAQQLEKAVALQNISEPERVVPAVWVELADALLAANRFNEVWKIFNKIMASPGALSTATRYRLARLCVDSRYPDFVRLGRALFEQIAKQQNITSAEREFHERSVTELANTLIREGNFADAETWLRTQIRLYPNGPEVGLAKLLLGVCLLQRANAPSVFADDAKKMRTEALGLFKENVAECDKAERRNLKLTEREAWLRLQSSLRVLQTHQQLRTAASARDLLYDAVPLLERHRGTVEELIILSLMYHAFRQVNDNSKALETRERMKDVFDKLPPTAFTKSTDEYSRDYWVKVWFPPSGK